MLVNSFPFYQVSHGKGTERVSFLPNYLDQCPYERNHDLASEVLCIYISGPARTNR